MQSGATMQIRWLRTALRDLDAEMTYIEERDKEAAKRLYALIRGRVALLAQFPDLGRPGRVFGTRELVLERYPYIIPYRVKNDTVEILRVFHTSRRQPAHW